jgi:hypothetical protein
VAEGKGIEVRISATGGDQAAAEVRKPTEAMKDQAAVEQDLAERKAKFQEEAAQRRKEMEEAQTSTGFGGMLDGSPERIEETSTALEKMAEAETKVAASVRDASTELGKESDQFVRRNNIAQAATIGLAAGSAIVAKTFGEIAEGLASIDLDKLRQMDAEIAAQVETARNWSQVLSDPLSSIQRFLSGSSIGEAFAEMNDQLARNARVQGEAVDRMISSGRKTADELRQVAKDIAAANELVDAKAQTEAKSRDVADAAKIREGASPEDVAAERAVFDRDAKIESINRGLEPGRARTQALYDDAQIAKGNAERVAADSRATPAARDEAEQKALAAEQLFLEAQKEYQLAKAIASEQRKGANIDYEGQIADLGFQKRDRIKNEQEALIREGNQYVEKTLSTQEREDAQRSRDEQSRIRDEGAAANIGRDAVKLLPDGLRGELRESITEASRKLQDGDQGGEIKTLISLVKQLAAITANQPDTAAAIAELKRDIATIEARQKNARTGK